MQRVVIHPGYPKAASSWLQQHLWDAPVTGLCAPWARRGGWGAPADVAENLFVRVEDADFDAEAALHRLGPGFTDARLRGLVPVLSHEMLIDRPNGLGGWAEPVARRLAATFEDARVVIVVREQREAIRSSYRHHIETGGRESVAGFIGGGGAILPLRISQLRYDVVVDLYDRLFGTANVVVVPFELLRVSPNAFARSVLEASDAPGEVPADLEHSAANKGSTAAGLVVQRALNHAVQPRRTRGGAQPFGWLAAVKAATEVGKHAPPRMLQATEQRLRSQVEAAVGDRFAASNRRLAARTGLDLASLGYPS